MVCIVLEAKCSSAVSSQITPQNLNRASRVYVTRQGMSSPHRLAYLSFLLLAGLVLIIRLLERSDAFGVVVLQELAEPDQGVLQLDVLALEGLLPVSEVLLLQSQGHSRALAARQLHGRLVYA